MNTTNMKQIKLNPKKLRRFHFVSFIPKPTPQMLRKRVWLSMRKLSKEKKKRIGFQTFKFEFPAVSVDLRSGGFTVKLKFFCNNLIFSKKDMNVLLEGSLV